MKRDLKPRPVRRRPRRPALAPSVAPVFAPVFALAFAVGACGSEADQRGNAGVEVRAVPDTIVTTESGLIGGLADWAVLPDGSLVLLDFQSRQVSVIDPGAASRGQAIRTIGRPGQGPGELERPASLFLGSEALTVVDPGNGRLQAFSFAGEASTSREFPACARGPSPPVPGPQGDLVRATLGFDPGLAVVCSADGEERHRLGEHLAPGQAMVNMAELRAQVLEGEVPGILLNSAHAVVGEEGAVWLLVSAAKQVERYDARGDRNFRITLEEPEFDAVRTAWIEQNRELDVGNLAGLNYLLRARVVGGDLWILTNAGERPGARVVVLSAEGDVRQRLDFTQVEGAGNFVVDEARGWVYFHIADTAEVVRVAFEPRQPE
jgi:hypothetical protein